jgi:hypothetical protein
VVADERRRIELARLEQGEDAIDVGDHVGDAEAQVKALEPGQAERDLGPPGVGADPGDGAGVAGEADRQRQRLRVADCVDGEVDAGAARRGTDFAFGVLLGQVQGGGAKASGKRQTLLDAVDREDLDGATGERGLDGAEPDRAEAEDGDAVAGVHAAVGDRVEAGAEDIAGEEGDLGAELVRHPPQGHVGARHQHLLSLAALQIAEVGAMAEGLAVAAALVVAAKAGCAGGASGVEAADDPVADGDPLDVLAHRGHRADELMADREPGLDRHPAVVDVEV